ncbi:unnamed protein product [Durusdinium trenchii]|uniref:Uncharacterized protein n=1 Tax=Durusdinium trenchii TaxID=1381693 RepID=A0ABP0PA51_9DINO
MAPKQPVWVKKWQKPRATIDPPKRRLHPLKQKDLERVGALDDNGHVLVAFNTPMNRHLLPVPDVSRQTGASLAKLLDQHFAVYDLAGFAILDLEEEPVEFQNGEANLEQIPGTDKYVQVKRQQIVLRKVPPKRKSLDVDDDQRSLGDWGFDPTHHAIQIYPEQVKLSFILEQGGYDAGPSDKASPDSNVLVHSVTTDLMDTVRLRDDPFEDDDPLEEDAQHRSETAGSILEMYKKRAKEVTHSLQQAMVQEHIPAIRSFTAVADELLTTTLDDGSNVVRGDVRSSLSQKKRKGMEALKVFHEYSELELKDWRYRRQALRLQHVTNTFDNDQKAVICTMFNALHKHRQFRGLASQYGPVCDAPAAWESVDRILRNDALAVKRDRVAFLHLAMFFLLHQNQEAELSPLYRFAADWVFALQAMGAFLFSIYFEEDVAAGRAICIESGLPVDLRRDDEQFLLYFYFEPSGQARVTLLNDVRNWSGALQLRDLEPPIRIPGFCRQRCFHVEQDLYDPSDVQVQGAAFLSFTILDFAKEFHWQRQQLGSLISKTDEEMAEYWLAGHNGASSAGLLPNSEASRKWIVRLANRRQRALLGRWNLGLRHTEVAYASSRKHVRMTNDRSIDAVQELWGSKGSEGIMPISLEPPNDAMDWALEGFLQQCLQDGKDDLGLEEEGIAVLAVCTEEELLVEVAQQRPELAWLLDPTLRQEQERRAEEIRSHWNRLGVEGPSRRWLKRKQETAAPALEAPGKGPSAKDEVQSMLEVLSQKRMKFRRVLRGVRLLQRLELLSSEKLRVLTHGSHMVFHGPGGAATLVREHKGSPEMPGSVFVEKMGAIAACSGADGY